MSRRPPAIVFDGDDNALSIVRSLAGQGVEVHLLISERSHVCHSRYPRLIRLPTGRPFREAATEFLTGSASDHLAGAVLLAANDDALEVVTEYRDTLAKKFLLDLSDPTAQLKMLNKLETYDVAREAGVVTPRFWRVNGAEDLERVKDELVYPLLVKPKRSHVFFRKFNTKFIMADSFPEVLEAYRTAEDAGMGVLLVESIPGPDTRLSSYYTYIDEDGKPLFDFTKRVIRRCPPGMGLACYAVTVPVDGVREPSLRLFRQAGLRGIANAEFKYDDRDGQLKLIECNARFTAANCLVASAGFDLGVFVYNRIAGLPQRPLNGFQSGLRLWDPLRDFRSFLILRKRGELTLAGWLSSLMHRQTFPAFSWRDPMPALVRTVRRLTKHREKPHG